MGRCAALLVFAGLAGCGSSEARPPSATLLPVLEGVALERIRVWRTPDGARVRGFDGALAPGVEIRVSAGAEGPGQRVVADEHGRFESALAPTDTVVVRVTGEDAVEFRVRDPEAARRDAILGVVGGVGNVPNDLVITTRLGVVARSGDNAVSRFDLAEGLGDGMRIPDRPPASGQRPVRSSPWFVEPLDPEANRVLVSDTGQHAVHVLNLAAQTVERTLRPPELVLDEPFPLARPLDVNDDGQADSALDTVRPTYPQAVRMHDGRIWAAFAGFLAPRVSAAEPPVFQPGVLVAWSLDNPGRPPSTLILDTLNPQWIEVLSQDKLLVVCSGVIDPIGTRVDSLSPGALIEVDVGAEPQVIRTVPLGARGPGSVVAVAGGWWVSSLVRGEIMRVDPETGAVTDTLTLTTRAVDSVFRLVDLGGGLIGAPSFNTDQLFVVDGRVGAAGALGGPLSVGAGGAVFDGLQVVARRPGRRGVDFVGPDLFALFGLSAEIVAIDLLAIMGP